MHIGIDFDNTIAGYDALFRRQARARGWIGPDFSGGKVALRRQLSELKDGERKWMALQGEVYGPQMAGAVLIEGVLDFLRHAAMRGIRVSIVSHKTEYGHYDATRTPLRHAARAWLAENGVTRPGPGAVAPGAVHFESDRAAKVARIAALGCTLFIDDLAAVFAEPGFPPTTTAVHFAPQGGSPLPCAFARWAEIERYVFG